MSKGSSTICPGGERLSGAGWPGSGRRGACPSQTASGTECSMWTGSGSRSTSWCRCAGVTSGASLMCRVKAVFWSCLMLSWEARAGPEELATIRTDEDVDFLYRTYSASPKKGGDNGGSEWGDRAVWGVHHRGRSPGGSIEAREYKFCRDALFSHDPGLRADKYDAPDLLLFFLD